MLTILFLGDIVGEPGRTAVIARLPELKLEHALDFIVVNGENAAGGRGISPKITIASVARSFSNSRATSGSRMPITASPPTCTIVVTFTPA